MADAYQVVRDFEQAVADWAGAPYGVAVESCCAGIFLSLLCIKPNYQISRPLVCPNRTYPGVPMAIVNAGYNLDFSKVVWEGCYYIGGTNVVDSALRFKKGMYQQGALWCLSFHYKKHLPIGRGGMVLTDSKEAMDWLKMARFDGRKEMPLGNDNASLVGWNMYMEPAQAARGLALFDTVKNKDIADLKTEDQGYPDLSTWRCFRE